MTFRKRLYQTLEPGDKGGWMEKTIEFIVIMVILLNILAVIMDTVEHIQTNYGPFLRHFEKFSVIFFTVEYIARVFCIVERPGFHHPIKGRLKFMKSPLAIIDMMAFLPFYLIFLPIDLRLLRIIRLMSLFRMFKVARYLHALKLFSRVLQDRKEQLILSIIFILFILVIISTVEYHVEHDIQPEAFSSIPATMWWGICTLTTVGYGDMVPKSELGKLLGGLFAIAGIGLFALPAGILSSGFYELMHQRKQSRKCPHCGEPVDYD